MLQNLKQYLQNESDRAIGDFILSLKAALMCLMSIGGLIWHAGATCDEVHCFLVFSYNSIKVYKSFLLYNIFDFRFLVFDILAF